MTDASDWSAWLREAENFEVLERAAASIYRQALRLGLPGHLLPCDDPWKLPPDKRADCIRELAGDLWVFLRERPPGWFERESFVAAAEKGERFLILRIAQEFLGYVKDRARTQAVDPRRALYRRLRQILHQEPSIAYRATSKGAFYALGAEAGTEMRLLDLSRENFTDWGNPYGRVTLKDLDRRKSLLTLAELFWERACQALGTKGFVPVRDLARFIGLHYPGFSVPDPTPPAGGSGGAPERANEHEPWEESPGEAVVAGHRIRELAKQLVATWTPRQRCAFALHWGDGLTLEETAKRMGYKAAAGAAYPCRSAVESLRDFCLLWPGLSPPDLDERLFEAFVQEIATVCKSDGESRSWN